MESKIMKLISLFISIFFFIFYVVIIDKFIASSSGSFLKFPYIISTIYFIIATLYFPFVSEDISEKFTEKNILARNYSMLYAYIVAPILLLKDSFKKQG